MDSFTHIVLGACVGEVVAGKALGRKALVLGAVANSLPDIDFVAGLWLNPANDLLAHRGFTHSLLFVVLSAVPIAVLSGRYVTSPLPMRKWVAFYLLQLFLHIFIDAFNAYGVAWFEPFAHARISFNALFVADPFFSAPLAIAFVFLVFSNQSNRGRRKAAAVALMISGFYLAYGIFNKMAVNRIVNDNLAHQSIPCTQYFSTPTPLNTWLWYIVINVREGSYVGYRSVFDSGDSIGFTYFPRNARLLEPVSDHEDLQRLLRFSEGYYTVENWGDTLVFNDLRFGQMIGWRDRQAHFVFHYFLSHPNDNDLVVQRGRFAGWDGEAMRSFIDRVKGH